MEGWIKLHRKTLDHWIFSNPNYLRAWITILFTVNYEKKKVLINGHLYDCNRGQSVLSLESWVDKFGVSKKAGSWTFQKVRTFFDLLENDLMITRENLTKTTRLTICNYDKYQDQQQTDNNQTTTKEQTDNTQTTTTKEVKKIRSKEVKNKSEKKKFSPPSLLEVETYCLERKNSVDPETWHAFYKSKGWMVGRNPMKDWQAAVRTWEKESSTGQKRNNTHSHIKVNHDSSY